MRCCNFQILIGNWSMIKIQALYFLTLDISKSNKVMYISDLYGSCLLLDLQSWTNILIFWRHLLQISSSEKSLWSFGRTQRIFSIEDGWMDKQSMVYTYNGMLFSLKKKEILTYTTTWMDLENFMLREISQTEKDKYCMISYIYEGPRGLKFIETESTIEIARGWWWVKGEWGVSFSGYEVSVWDDEKLWRWRVVKVEQYEWS